MPSANPSRAFYTKVKVVLASLSSQARFGFSEVAFGVASRYVVAKSKAPALHDGKQELSF